MLTNIMSVGKKVRGGGGKLDTLDLADMSPEIFATFFGDVSLWAGVVCFSLGEGVLGTGGVGGEFSGSL